MVLPAVSCKWLRGSRNRIRGSGGNAAAGRPFVPGRGALNRIQLAMHCTLPLHAHATLTLLLHAAYYTHIFSPRWTTLGTHGIHWDTIRAKCNNASISIPETCKAQRHTAAAQLAGNMHDEAATSRSVSDLAFPLESDNNTSGTFKNSASDNHNNDIGSFSAGSEVGHGRVAGLASYSKEEQGGHENKKHVYCFIQLPTAKSSNHPAKRHRRDVWKPCRLSDMAWLG